MKKITLFLVLAFCLTMMGCSKDGEIEAFVTELDSVSNEIVQKINAGDVDGAKTAFDAKKESLKSKWDSFKNARGFQVSADTKKKAEEGLKKNVTAVTVAVATNSIKFAMDKGKSEKLQALSKEYMEIFKM